MNLIDLWLVLNVLVPTFAGALLAAELGYRLGAFRRAGGATGVPSGAGTIVGSLFALTAFMLAFTFGSAASRFGARRQLVVEEANAVSTAFLRADLLRPPWAERLRDHLRDYVELRLEAVRTSTPEMLAAGIRRSEDLHGLMWSQAMEAIESRPAPTNALVLQALNDVIDIHTDRVAAALYSQMPVTIWVSLLLVAAAGMLAVGCQAGLSGPRPSLVTFLLMFAFSTVIMLIADLDHFQGGWLETSQDALQDAERVMQSAR